MLFLQISCTLTARRMPDDNFDWVTVRKTCSPQRTFCALRLQVERDVNTRNVDLNPVPPVPGKTALKIAGMNGTFEVSRGDRKVLFTCNGTGITITGDGLKIKHVSVRLNKNGECEVVDQNENPIQLWRIIYLALGALFFTDADRD